MATTTAGPRPVFGVFGAAAVMVGMVVGVGIFTFPSMVAARAPGEWSFLGFWIAGGVVAIIGALCYSELAARHPDSGGEYQYLTRAYGGRVGFLFAWARMTVIQTGSIAVAAYILGAHATELWSLGPYSSAIYASVTVAALTLLHWYGTGPSKAAQTIFTTMVVGLLLASALAAIVVPTQEAVAAVDTAGGEGSLGAAGMAMVFVLLTYGGWNETAYLTGEMRDAGRTTMKALALGIGAVTLTYVLINLAYLDVLGLDTIRRSNTPGADLISHVAGSAAGDVMTGVVVLAALSTINATIMTGARTNYALGRDFAFMGVLGRWDERRNAPGNALLVQATIAVVLIVAGALSEQSTIETMVEYTAPVFWLFLALVGSSLFVFRRRARDGHARPTVRVPLYPFLPAIFVLVCAMMLYSSLLSFGLGALLGVVILVSGVPVMAAGRWLAHRG